MYNESNAVKYPQMKVGLINGAYFCRSGCTGDPGAPQGLYMRYGNKFNWTGVGSNKQSALVIRDGYRGSIETFGPDDPPDSNNTTGIQHAISGGPIILWNGSTDPCNPEGENNQSHCNGANYRTGACLSADGWILRLLISEGFITAKQFGTFMKSKGCDDGMEFDGGSSTAMVWKGSLTAPTGSIIGTGIMVWDTSLAGMSTPEGMSKEEFQQSVISDLTEITEAP